MPPTDRPTRSQQYQISGQQHFTSSTLRQTQTQTQAQTQAEAQAQAQAHITAHSLPSHYASYTDRLRRLADQTSRIEHAMEDTASIKELTREDKDDLILSMQVSYLGNTIQLSPSVLILSCPYSLRLRD
jgi:phage shock protein A